MPLDGPALVDAEAWWAERRLMARKLIDSGNAQLALSLLEGYAQISREAKLDTANLAGWIALRLLHDPARAAPHFNNAVKLAEGPTMIARSSYWLARTAEAVDQLELAVVDRRRRGGGRLRASDDHKLIGAGEIGRAHV